MTQQTLIRSQRTGPSGNGLLLDITPAAVGWEFVHFIVRRLVAGEKLPLRTRGEECAIVLLSGAGEVTIDAGAPQPFGPRTNVFDSYPHGLYLPDGHAAVLLASQVTEVAECRAPSRAVLEPRVIAPADCGFEIRGGGNATRQIVDILPPAFPADKLLICEVFTPGGNWSSYPPHKHDVDNPPGEVDLEEIYYYRMKQPDGYGLQRLYTADGARDETVKVEDGDLVLVRDGYHPYVSAYGIDSYYLNVLAGTRRSMAASDDPRYAAVRSSWPAPDPRLPMIEKP
ncbi:MAG: 5-deoxy-glucuronate isomerase [Acidobacteriota bacterium]|nr:5-deoxy-glucuronate isomerase [Acidobacteriota bacterium]MDQ3419705.1 5-deoxy-glucuronate isomerase [Acidobacteriota bacterium]